MPPPEPDAAALAARALHETAHNIARALSELEAAAEARLAEAQARHAATLAREVRICKALQERLFELERALRDADERRAADAGAFADQLAKRHAEFTANLTQTLQARDALAIELAAVTAALEEAREQHQAAAAAAAEQLHASEAEFRSALSESEHGRALLERALADAREAHRQTSVRAEMDLAAAGERQAALDDLLTQESDRRTTLEQQVASAEAALEDAAQRHTSELARAAARLADVQARYDAALEAGTGREAQLTERLAIEAESTAALEAQLAGARAEIARERGERDALLHQLRAAQDQIQQLQRVSTEYAHLRTSFDQLQSAFQSLEGTAGAHAAERARLESVLAVRESELTAQTQRHRAMEQAAQEAFAQTEAGLKQTLAAKETDVARLQQERDTLRRELDAARRQAESLRRDAERVPGLEWELELSEKERRGEFERAPFALCRCRADGVITDANHAFVAMLGLKRVEDLRSREFAAAVFDHAGDLGWLVERAREVRRTDSIETTWKGRDGRDLLVRLQASATASGSIEILVEDITRVRALEERLGRAQRMEAVGRLASEVAATCDALLGDVARGVQEWAATITAADALRQGDRLLTDVRRAASYLRQLGVYGDQQVRALAPVSVQRVLADLAPVLTRVAGDQIALIVSKSSASLDVDVEAERLERVLVNVASYARERMPHGGQIRIDVEATALGRRFVSRYPNVRPGNHVLITVTELQRADAAYGESRRSERPGLELAALVDLVGTCGGHLWLEAQPAGNLVVKMYLPRRARGDMSDRGVPVASPAALTGRLAKWFRVAPTMKLRA